MAASPTAAPGSGTHDRERNGHGDFDSGHRDRDRGSVRRSTETKSAFKTTELIVYIVAVIAVLIAAQLVDQSDAGGLGAKQAWLYVTILSVGYMISRGIAKAGSRDPYTEDR